MKRVKPEVVGLSASRLEHINKFMQGSVDQQKIAGGITLLARRGQVAHFECVGMRNIEAGQPMQPGTIFRIYSMTKPIASVAAMMLYEAGHFLLDDPVADYIPEFKETPVFAGGDERDMELVPQEQPLTIRHLLAHTSGLVYGNPEGSPVEKLVWQKDREMEEIIAEETLAEWIPRLAKLPLANQPGKAWQYGVSTAADYLQFAQMLLNRGTLSGVCLLSRKTVELMTSNNMPQGLHPWDDPAFSFGLGGSIMTDVARAGSLGSVGIFSWGGAASTDQWVDPKEDMVGLFLIQYMPYFGRAMQQYRVLAYQAIDD